MAMTLAELAPITPDPLVRGITEIFVQESPILDRLPLKQIAGNAFAYSSELTLPGVAFRSVNEAYTESTGTFNQATETLSILGGDADVDTYLVKTGGNLYDLRAVQSALKVKAASYAFQDTFFNGDVAVNPKAFDGLKKRLVGAQVISSGANGAAINTDANARNNFFDKLDELLSLVKGINGSNGAIYANNAVQAKIRSAGRQLGGTDMFKEALTGKNVLTYNGIPVLDPGDTAAGVRILAQTETQGTSNLASSVYAVKFGSDVGDAGVTGITNGGISVRDLGEIDAKPVYRTRIEFFCGMAVFGGKAAARLTGVLGS